MHDDQWHRRGIAVLARIAEEGEPTSVSVSWDQGSLNWVILQEFSSTSSQLALPLDTAAIASHSGWSATSLLELPPSGLEAVEAVILGGVGLPGGDYGEYLRAPSSSSLDITGEEFTLEAWVHAGPGGWSADGDTGFISKSHSPGNNVERYHLGVTRGGFINVRRHSGGTTVRFDAGDQQVPEDEWVYLAARYDGSELTAWLNGLKVGAAAAFGPVDSSDRDLRVGARYDHRRFSGDIEEVRVSSVARSGDWILTTFENQSSPEAFVAVESEELFH